MFYQKFKIVKNKLFYKYKQTLYLNGLCNNKLIYINKKSMGTKGVSRKASLHKNE